MTLGETLRAARKAKGKSMREVGTCIGVSAPYLNDVEHDRRAISDERLGQLAVLLEVDAGPLFALRSRWSRDLADWIKDQPELVELLHEARRTGRKVQLT